jgi:hypothetical protein
MGTWDVLSPLLLLLLLLPPLSLLLLTTDDSDAESPEAESERLAVALK